jgi:flagellar basal body-associated protein FliL
VLVQFNKEYFVCNCELHIIIIIIIIIIIVVVVVIVVVITILFLKILSSLHDQFAEICRVLPERFIKSSYL